MTYENVTDEPVEVPVVNLADFDQAVRLLGLTPTPERPLMSVHIEDGRVYATYGQYVRINGNPAEQPEPAPNSTPRSKSW
ncbi:hypothetical protein [Nocardia sp. CC201C]|uniref:hypothetical protein n=1 Tax=Nocardia sp. CC201C TaxID=3044575 RepID=UPI0024A8CBC8|nr:hypothetical protein [Nocardia sp. CC201C]